MSSSATSCFKCQINFSCEIALEFHQLIFHFESDNELESHLYLDPSLTETSHQDVGKQIPSSGPNFCEESQNEIDDFDWTTFNEVPSKEADWELESYVGLDSLLSEPQDVQKNLGEQVLATEPYFCEESQNKMDDFDWTTFNEVPSEEADWELESYVGLDSLLSEPQDVQKNQGVQVLATEPYPCEESQNDIDDSDWTTFNEVPSTEADCGLESHMDLDSQLTKHQDVQEDVGERILTTKPYHCEESQIKSDNFHQTSFIQVSRTENSCDQEQNKHHKTVQKKFCKERKDHKCNVCRKTFTKQSQLKTHVKTVDDKQKGHKCEVCQKTFSQQSHLKIFIKNYTVQNFYL
ncbi:hypothetical protein TKK_0002330 [Trichogramma kaykai]|uniref:C2H2-type domain-containing protein n=1 Tax=Trichogramma kaykai TaxID=54128 RepID=A0ABD2XBP1_9HYME